MGVEAGHIQITEFNKEVIPSINYMMEDLFCQYGVNIPWFMCDFKFPDYSQRPDWVSGYNFNLDWGEWGYWLVWFNEMLGLLFDEAHLPRWQMPDLSPGSWAFFNNYTEILYDNMQRHYVYDQSGTFTKDEVIEGEDSGITGWYKWIDGDGYIHVANKRDASGETVADFEDEKIVGQTSGTYAWTYEDYWVSPLRIYHSAGGHHAIRKCSNYSWGGKTVEESWTSDRTYGDPPTAWGGYEIAPVIDGFQNIVVRWGTWAGPYSGGYQIEFEFDTSNAPTGASHIYLYFRVQVIEDGHGTPILELYTLDHDLDDSDWSSGSYIAEKTVSSTGWNYIELEEGDINIGGTTRFRVTLDKMQNDTRTTTIVWQYVYIGSPMTERVYLSFVK